MKHLAKSVARRALGSAGWIDRPTPPSAIAALLRKLRPQAFGRPLVRFGPAGDGGYLMPDDLDGVVAAISPGVSTECGFDLALAGRGIDVFMADASVAGPPVANPRFHFEKLFLDSYDDATRTTVNAFCSRPGGPPPAGDLVLQMDIEGAEYRVVPSIADDLLRRFRIIIVEMHDLDQMFGGFAFPVIAATFARLTQHHRVVHIHPNNCCGMVERHGIEVPRVMEFTFYRSDRATFSDAPHGAFPHALDVDVHPRNPPIVLPGCWR